MAAYTCVIHFEATNIEERVILFSETTFERVKDCTEKWARLACQQGDVARQFGAIVSCDSIGEAVTQGFGFHKKCYNRFTDSTRYVLFHYRS